MKKINLTKEERDILNDIESNNGITWEKYHEKYQDKIDNLLIYECFNFPLLKKCINIYLYKIFDYIK